MRQYLDLLKEISEKGILRPGERTGTGTRAVFFVPLEFFLGEGYPTLTTKFVPFRLVLGELLWMISGSRNIKPLVDENINIWNEWPFQRYLKKMKLVKKYPKYSDGWKEKLKVFIQGIKEDALFAEEFGDLGPVYGFQWRHWKGRDGKKVDQLATVIENIKKNPQSRRHIVTAWDPSVLDKVALPPCHMYFQFFVGDGTLDCTMYQRSVDSFLGLPFNIASYAALTMMVAQVCGLKANKFNWIGGDTHIYLNHQEQVALQLTRKPKPLPTLVIDPTITDIDSFNKKHFRLDNYQYEPAIKGEISV